MTQNTQFEGVHLLSAQSERLQRQSVGISFRGDACSTFNNHELAWYSSSVNSMLRILLAVFGAAVLLGKKEEDVLVALSTLHPVAGRFDAIRSPQGYTAIVDYAHTPDALVNVLERHSWSARRKRQGDYRSRCRR